MFVEKYLQNMINWIKRFFHSGNRIWFHFLTNEE